tara:strand:- start:824 stop:1552 length:729 start_codon:yes stop_codon:yes gene_type:complete
MNISLVIPALNEGKNVFLLALEIEKVLSTEDQFEIIFVDDGSTDDTYECMLEAKKSIDLDLHTIHSRRNNGQSIAILMGVKEAKYEWVMTLDSDLQNKPENFSILIDQMRSNPDVFKNTLVAGIRKERNDNFVKKVSSKIANSVRQYLLKDECVDTGCGLKLFNKEFFLELPHFKNMHRFLPALYKMHGGSCQYIEVTHSSRIAGISKYGTFDRLIAGVWDLIGVMWLKNRMKMNLDYEYQK